MLCAAAAGVQVLSKAQLGRATNLRIAADVNAVPPAGVEGVDVQANGDALAGTQGRRHRCARNRQHQVQSRGRAVQEDDRGAEGTISRLPRRLRAGARDHWLSPPTYLIVALSARALAVAARRAGCPACALDLYGDLDTRANAVASGVIAGDLGRGFDESALLAAANRFAPRDALPAHGIVYGAGFEDRPALLERLSRGRRLCGNAPEVVARDEGAARVLRAARRPSHSASRRVVLGAARPRGLAREARRRRPAAVTSRRPPYSDRSRVTSTGSVASQGVRSASPSSRTASGPVCSASASSGRRPTASSPFRFGGMLQPAALEPVTATGLRALLDPLVRALGLVGLEQPRRARP